MNSLYLDLKCGISGDMFVAAMLDLGADQKLVESVLSSINLEGFSVAVSRVTKANLDMCDFKVKLTVDNHDSDMDYLFPQAHRHLDHEHHDGEHSHHHEHEHAHRHEHSHEHHHDHRNLEDVIAIINKSTASVNAKRLAEKIFTDEYFVEKAKGMEAYGAKIITLKDMAGLVSPMRAASLISKLKAAVSVPVDFHTHCTPGYGLASVVMAMLNGVDIVDTNIWYFGGGSAAPAIELVYLFAKRMDIEVEVNMEAVGKIRKELKAVRQDLADFDLHKNNFPIDFDPLADTLPAEVEALFDKAVAAARAGDEDALLDACHAIEAYFKFPKPNLLVKEAEVPGGMYSNMVAQLKALNSEDVLDEKGGGRLAVGSGYADQFDPLVGAVVEGAHQPGIGPPGVGHLNVGGLLLIVLEVPFVHDHLSAGVDGLIDEIVRVKT